jgi:hypothetical protein
MKGTEVYKPAFRAADIAIFLIVSAGILSAQVTGGMLNPEIDRPDQPFSYFWHPTDILGTYLGRLATEVTPEGNLYTGFGELMFYAGNPPVAFDQRVKTLYRENLPIVQYHFERDGVQYSVTMLAIDLGGKIEGLPVNLVRVELSNLSAENRTAFLSSAVRFSAPIEKSNGTAPYRFRQRFDLVPKEYSENQSVFNSKWKYTFDHGAVLRDGSLLYLFPESPVPAQKNLTRYDNGLGRGRFFTGEVEVRSDEPPLLQPETAAGFVTYRVPLAPGESRSLVFKMPVVPLPPDSVEAQKVRDAEWDSSLKQTVEAWQELLRPAERFHFPEAKVQNALTAGAAYNLLAIDKVGDDYIVGENKFQYHVFYGGMWTSFMMAALDDLGYHDLVGETLLYDLTTQKPEGYFYNPGQDMTYWSDFGEVFWSWNHHYQLAPNEQFLRAIYPAVLRCVDWVDRATAADPLGLLPPSTVMDDEQLKDAHFTGMNMWAIIGLRSAVELAQAANRPEDVKRFQALRDRLDVAFHKQLTKQTALSGGYIPAAMDRTLAGNYWYNLMTLYPEPLFDPFDSRVTATLQKSRADYAEGMLTYLDPKALALEGDTYRFNEKRLVISWLSTTNALNHLVRGSSEDQRLAVQDLYAVLLHTSSTHALNEFGQEPWGTRDFSYTENITPHALASARLIELLRNILVREYKNDLYLFSAVSPEWTKPGNVISADDVPTKFGSVTARMTIRPDGYSVELANHFRKAPSHLVVRIPYFYQDARVKVDGVPVTPDRGAIQVSPNARKIEVEGKKRTGTEPLSYDRAVAEYKQEYRQRYEEFLRTGEAGQVAGPN